MLKCIKVLVYFCNLTSGYTKIYIFAQRSSVFETIITNLTKNGAYYAILTHKKHLKVVSNRKLAI